MRNTLRKQMTGLAGITVSGLLSVACSAGVDSPRVDFGVSKPIGRWELESAQSLLGDASVEVVTANELGAGGKPASASGPASGTTVGSMQSGAATASMAAAGRASSSPAANSGKAGSGGTNAGSDKASAAGSGGAMTATDIPQAVTSLAFNFTTEPVGGRYKPKNIGAVWITDSSGKLVKSLEVWAFLRLRYLTKYAGVRGSARADVTASATLPNHSKPHMASWDLKDTSGTTVKPGKYTLNAEITDQDATGKSMSFDFDTSGGPMTLTPPASAGFTKLELVLK